MLFFLTIKLIIKNIDQTYKNAKMLIDTGSLLKARYVRDEIQT